MVSINKSKKNFDEKSNNLFTVKIKNIGLNNGAKDNYGSPEGLFTDIEANNFKNEIIRKLEELKQEKIQLFIVCSDTFEMIIEYLKKQADYFSCIVEILNKIRNNYTKIVNKGENDVTEEDNMSFSELKNICIDSDIDIYKGLSTNLDISRIQERRELIDNELKILGGKKSKSKKQKGGTLSDIIQLIDKLLTNEEKIIEFYNNTIQPETSFSMYEDKFIKLYINSILFYFKDIDNIIRYIYNKKGDDRKKLILFLVFLLKIINIYISKFYLTLIEKYINLLEKKKISEQDYADFINLFIKLNNTKLDDNKITLIKELIRILTKLK